MNFEYLYNRNTHCMHINSFCCYAHPNSGEFISYESEDEAIQNGVRFIMCKRCAKKRDEKMRREMQE